MSTGRAYRRIFGGYLSVSLFCVALHGLLPAEARRVTFSLVALGAVPPMYFAARHCPPQGRRTIWLMFISLVLLSAGDGTVNATKAGAHVPDVITSALLTAGTIGLLLAALSFVRLRGRYDVGGLLDVAVVSVAGGGLLWTAVLQPRLDMLDVPFAVQAELLLNVMLLTGVLGALIRLQLTAGEHIVALRFIIAALVLTLGGNITLAALVGSLSEGAPPGVEVLFLSAYTLFGAVGLHPSLHKLVVPGAAPTDRLTPGRLVFLGAALAVPPIAGAGRQLFGLPVDGLLLAASAMITVPLVMARIGHLARQRVEAEVKLVHQATHDALTGLVNRAEFLSRLEPALAYRSANGREDVVLLFCDLDGFKNVNDRLGHTVGDELLVSVARRLAGTVARKDTIARYGGDEFLVMCTTTNPMGARASVSRRIAAALSDPFDVAGERVSIGVSVGSAVAGEHETADSLISRADAAMYESKQRGRVPVSRTA